MFLLEIVTFGIYRLYFLIKTRREMMDLNPEIKIKSNFFLFAPVVVLAAGIVLLAVSFHSADGKITSCSSSQSSSSQDSSYYSAPASCHDSSPANLIGILGIYLAIFIATILFVIWLWSYSHGVATITDGKLSFALGLTILFLVPDGIDILIFQDYFNKVSTPAAVAAPPAV